MQFLGERMTMMSLAASALMRGGWQNGRHSRLSDSAQVQIGSRGQCTEDADRQGPGMHADADLWG